MAAWAAASGALALVILVVVGGSATAGLTDSGPPKEADKLLREMRDHLDEAAAQKLSGPQKRAIREATIAKLNFADEMFTGGQGQSLFGCTREESSSIFFRLENVDLSAEMAWRGRAKDRGDWLDDAATSGADAADLVATCPGAGEAERVDARDIANRADSLLKSHKAGDLSDAKLKTNIARLAGAKRRLLSGQTIYDCDAFGFYDRVKDIDLRLVEALEEGERERRDRLIDLASRRANQLIELWKRAPCPPQCSDGLDNDEDGTIDAADPGCRTGSGAVYDGDDRSEQHGASTGLNCSSLPFNSPVDVFIGNPNAGSTIIRHNLRNLTSGRLLVEKDSTAGDFSLGGPVDLGTGACGPGTTATAEWARNGTDMSWHLTVTKTNSGVIPPNHLIVAAADTR